MPNGGSRSIFERAESLETLHFLQPTLRQRCQMEEKTAPISVDSDVTMKTSVGSTDSSSPLPMWRFELRLGVASMFYLTSLLP
jgi:hypothetical protein